MNIIEAGFVRRGDTLAIGDSTFEVADFELGPEQGEVSFYRKSLGGLPGERYIFATDAPVNVVSHRNPMREG